MIILASKPDYRNNPTVRYVLAWPDDRGAYVFDVRTGHTTHVNSETLKNAYRPAVDLRAATNYFNHTMDRLFP